MQATQSNNNKMMQDNESKITESNGEVYCRLAAYSPEKASEKNVEDLDTVSSKEFVALERLEKREKTDLGQWKFHF